MRRVRVEEVVRERRRKMTAEKEKYELASYLD